MRVTSCEGSFDDGKGHIMIQSEGGNQENKSDNYKLTLFQMFYFLCMHQGYLGYISDEKGNELVEGSTIYLVQMGALIGTVVECFPEQETRRGNRQKSYADKLGWNMKLAVQQIVGQLLTVW